MSTNYSSFKFFVKSSLKIFSMIAIISSSFSSCSDVFEDDISKKNVELISPIDNYRMLNSTVKFWWYSLEGATAYNIEIVKVDTSLNYQPIELIVDSNLTDVKFEINLEPGSYSWSIVAFNAGYQTQGVYRIFHVDSTLDISSSTVELLNPNNLFSTSDSVIDFSWIRMYNADYYTIEIRNPDQNGSLIHLESDLTNPNYTYTLQTDGHYAWAVSAYNNSTGTSSRKVWRSLIYDTTAPLAPSLLSPANNDTLYSSDLINQSIHFKWDIVADQGAAISYHIEISYDSLFSSSNLLQTANITDTAYNWSVTGTYTKMFWRVKSVDDAGNIGGFSSYRRFWYFDY